MAICETKLLTEQELKNWTDIPNNLSTKLFATIITQAQDMHIRTVLGEDLFSELLEQVENSTETALNLTLLNGDDRLFRGLKPALAWWVAYNLYPFLHSKVSPTGIQTKSTEDATAIDSQMLAMRRKMAKAKAEYYSQQLICYLEENDTDYPLFRDGTCCTDIKYDGYGSSGIALDVDKQKDINGLTREDLI